MNRERTPARQRVTYGLLVAGILGTTVIGWSKLAPAQAQDNGGRGRMMMGGGPTAIAASGDFVYVLRGGTLYQMKSADLSVVTQKDLPAPGGGAAGAGGAGGGGAAPGGAAGGGAAPGAPAPGSP